MHKALIVDDEFHGRENLKLLLEELFDDIKVIDTASNVFQAKMMIEKHNPDIVFMDIQMDVLTGLDLLEVLKRTSIFKVVVTAYMNYAKEALILGANGYLLKPIISAELIEVISLFKKSKEQENSDESALMIKHNRGYTVSELASILMVKAINNYCKIYFIDGTSKTISNTLKSFENKLQNPDFFRVHKTFLVNMKNVKEYSVLEGGSVILLDGTCIKVAISKRTEVKKMLKSISIVVND